MWNPRYVRLTLTLLLVAFGLAGCEVPFAVEPKELPGALERVIDDSASFDADANPLHGVEAGTVIDPLEKLDGCWGGYAKSTTLINGRPAVEIYHVYIIDWETQTYTHWSYGRDALGLAPGLVGMDGRFEVAGNRMIQWRGEQAYYSDAQTGELREMTEEDLLEDGERPTSRDSVTLSGQYARFWSPDESGNFSDEADALYLTRFDCRE